jgi:heat shock transcription factor
MSAPGVQMNLLNGTVGAANMGQVMGPAPPNDILDPFDRELNVRIEKMRKKRASIPPFVQKLSRLVFNLFLVV